MAAIQSLAPEQRQKQKTQFIELLQGTQRAGIDSLLQWLEADTDFYDAPASSQFHGAFEGGLLNHSLAVYKYLNNFTKALPDCRADSLVIMGLLHDICKVNFFVKSIKNVKVPGERRWEEKEIYTIDDSLPMGHGEKSVYLAMKHIALTDEEALAIRWHMGGYDDAARAYAGGRAQSGAFEKYPCAAALNIADMYVTHILGQ